MPIKIKRPWFIIKILEKSLDGGKMNLNIEHNEGDKLFLMALSQNLYEPLKIELLEKAAIEHIECLCYNKDIDIKKRKSSRV